MNNTTERKLQEALLLRSRPGEDALVLDDGVLQAALDGSRALTAVQLAALQASPLTLRRFRHLALERKRAQAVLGWQGSRGMLRAASSSAELSLLTTDDGCWSLHFVPQGAGWQVILKLEAQAEFAAQVLARRPMLRVTDGGGGVLLQGRLDADGECERAWAFADAPDAYFQAHGAVFHVEPLGP
ncbi:hypothetical protein [Pseudoduganella sp. OTU4001]|uniref:hypothetical protein n=1 Tax=Pseudoduganella sp. OTU4001 TaxID=3043854 RepID=UPI00313EC914